jgi:hypothetical protein
MTTHSLPGSEAKTQQLVANMGAANESINKLITPLIHAQFRRD